MGILEEVSQAVKLTDKQKNSVQALMYLAISEWKEFDSHTELVKNCFSECSSELESKEKELKVIQESVIQSTKDLDFRRLGVEQKLRELYRKEKLMRELLQRMQAEEMKLGRYREYVDEKLGDVALKEKHFEGLFAEIRLIENQMESRKEEIDKKERKLEKLQEELELREDILELKLKLVSIRQSEKGISPSQTTSEEPKKGRKRCGNSALGSAGTLDAVKEEMETEERSSKRLTRSCPNVPDVGQITANNLGKSGSGDILVLDASESDSGCKEILVLDSISILSSSVNDVENEKLENHSAVGKREELIAKEHDCEAKKKILGAEKENLLAKKKELEIREKNLAFEQEKLVAAQNELAAQEKSLNLRMEPDSISGTSKCPGEDGNQVLPQQAATKEPGSNAEQIVCPGSIHISDSNPSSLRSSLNGFNDENKLKSLAAGQTWATYDEKYDLPISYFLVIELLESKHSAIVNLRVVWLQPVSNSRKRWKGWIDAGLPVGCGVFKRGKEQALSLPLDRFSGQVCCEANRSSCLIHPDIGETWALYQDWEIATWARNPENHTNCKYDIVEVLGRNSKGTIVAYLDKLEAFVSLFQRRSQSEKDSFLIEEKDLFRFSHKVPSFKMTGGESRGVPEGSFELDPKDLPEGFH